MDLLGARWQGDLGILYPIYFCTVGTISTALSSLARTDRIWRGELYFGEGKSKNGRIYYGAKGIDKILDEQFRNVSQTKRSATNYKTLAPGE
jgi:hypothetical protein